MRNLYGNNPHPFPSLDNLHHGDLLQFLCNFTQLLLFELCHRWVLQICIHNTNTKYLRQESMDLILLMYIHWYPCYNPPPVTLLHDHDLSFSTRVVYRYSDAAINLWKKSIAIAEVRLPTPVYSINILHCLCVRP